MIQNDIWVISLLLLVSSRLMIKTGVVGGVVMHDVSESAYAGTALNRF